MSHRRAGWHLDAVCAVCAHEKLHHVVPRYYAIRGVPSLHLTTTKGYLLAGHRFSVFGVPCCALRSDRVAVTSYRRAVSSSKRNMWCLQFDLVVLTPRAYSRQLDPLFFIVWQSFVLGVELCTWRRLFAVCTVPSYYRYKRSSHEGQPLPCFALDTPHKPQYPPRSMNSESAV